MTSSSETRILVRTEWNGLILVGEIVTHSPLGHNELRSGAVPLDFLAQAADMDVYRAHIAHVIIFPNRLSAAG